MYNWSQQYKHIIKANGLVLVSKAISNVIESPGSPKDIDIVDKIYRNASTLLGSR